MQGAGSAGRRQVRLPAGLPRQEPGGEWLLPAWPRSQDGAGGTAGGPGATCPLVAPPCPWPGPSVCCPRAHAPHPLRAGGFGVLIVAKAVGLLPLLVPRGCAFPCSDHSSAGFPCLLGAAPHLMPGPGCPSGGCQARGAQDSVKHSLTQQCSGLHNLRWCFPCDRPRGRSQESHPCTPSTQCRSMARRSTS